MLKRMFIVTLAALIALSAALTRAQTPPEPPNTPPDVCDTGKTLPEECLPQSARGYPKVCPRYTPGGGTNGADGGEKYLCQPPVEPAIPYIECEQYGMVSTCVGYPSESPELSFSWTGTRGVDIYSFGANNRYVDISCTGLTFTARVTVVVHNSLTGQETTVSEFISCGDSELL